MAVRRINRTGKPAAKPTPPAPAPATATQEAEDVNESADDILDDEDEEAEDGSPKRGRKKLPPKNALPEELLVDDKGNSVVNEDGKLIDLPACLYADAEDVADEATGRKGHASAVYKKLAKDAFAEPWVPVLMRAESVERNIARSQTRLKRLREQVEYVKTHGDEEMAKKIQKLQALQRRHADLFAQLQAEGVSADMLGSIGADDEAEG